MVREVIGALRLGGILVSRLLQRERERAKMHCLYQLP